MSLEEGIDGPAQAERHGVPQMQHLDLTSWTGRRTKVLQELFARIKRLLARTARARRR